MMYRKKPIIIEAFQWTGGPDQKEDPEWIRGMLEAGTIESYRDPEKMAVVLRIKTLEGVMTVSPGDFIILGVNGEVYPCKPDIFHKTYDPV